MISSTRASSTATSPGLAATAAPAADAARSGVRTSTVLIYLTLAVVALIPGLLIKLGIWLDHPLIGDGLKSLRASLDDIRFGSGVRFWFGVSGATMMGLLLFYPLRKVFAGGRWLGRIGGWFHWHIVFGIAGPVLILYHSNFGHGSSNANAALWSMLTIAASGIAGHFIYAGVSATFYALKQSARAELDELTGALKRFDALPVARQRLVEDLETFDTDLLTPRQGVLASLAARLRMERQRSALAHAVSVHIAQCADHMGLDDSEHEQLRLLIGGHFGGYIHFARQASSRSIREQLWARWRMFHLPVFLLMVVAAALHIWAVWDIDGPSNQAAATVGDPAPVATRPVPAPKGLDVKRVATQKVDRDPAEPKLIVAPKLVQRSAPLPGVKPAEDIRAEPKLVSPPKPVAAVEAVRPVTKAEVKPAVKPEIKPEIKDVYAELERRIQDPPQEAPMALGLPKPRTLAEQIAVLKVKQAAKQFAHSEVETGFALTGHHLKADCASCHSKPLQETRSSEPRQCIACHKQDDVHRGRRPNCANCHTTNNWNERIRKR